MSGPGCPPQIKQGVELKEGPPFAVWTRPPKTTLGPCDQEQEELRLRSPREVKVGMNMGGEERLPGLLESVSWDLGASTKGQELSLDPPQLDPRLPCPCTISRWPWESTRHSLLDQVGSTTNKRPMCRATGHVARGKSLEMEGIADTGLPLEPLGWVVLVIQGALRKRDPAVLLDSGNF